MTFFKRFRLLCFFIFNVVLVLSVLAEDSSPSTVTNPDGTTITTMTKPDGTTIKTIDHPDGTTIKTINFPDGTTIKTTIKPDGSSEKITVKPDGTIISDTSNPTADIENAPSSVADTGSSSVPSPPATPPPVPSTPLVAPYDIDMVAVWLGKERDKDHLFLMSSSCVTAEQWVAFLNAVAKFNDPHGLYNEAMTYPPDPKTDIHGQTTTPCTAQIIRSTFDSEKGWTYSVLDRDVQREFRPAIYDKDHQLVSPAILLPPNRELPVTYVNLFDAARFCNWLHHGQPSFQKGENPDDATEGGAYLLDDGLDLYHRETFHASKNYKDIHCDMFKTIIPVSGALWRIPPFFAYRGIHDGGKNPDFTEPGCPSKPNDQDGFYDNYAEVYKLPFSHYEWTSTHHTTCIASEHSYHRLPQYVGNYYKVKSPTVETTEVAEATKFVLGRPTDEANKSLDSDTSFRVMPVGNVSIPDTIFSEETPESAGPLP